MTVLDLELPATQSPVVRDVMAELKVPLIATIIGEGGLDWPAMAAGTTT